MIINHNLSAQFADRSLGITQNNLTKNMEKLTSGLRINRAGDDASGLAVSEKFRSQIRGLNQASANASNGISFVQTTEGYLQETQDILHRLRELAVQSANGIYTQDDRTQIEVEVSQLISEVDRIANHAQFNTLNMLTGRYADPQKGGVVSDPQGPLSMVFHIGANMDQRIQVYIEDMTATGLKLRDAGDQTNRLLTLSNATDANTGIGMLDKALGILSKQRADLGAYQNRLEHTIAGLDVGSENFQASESRIRDTDMAKQMVSYTRDQILSQAGNAMLAQSNQRTQSVLQLLQ